VDQRPPSNTREDTQGVEGEERRRRVVSLPKFEYLAPRTVEEACSLLSQYREKAKVIAGGTDLLVGMKEREQTPQYMVGLKGVANLDYIDYGDIDGLRIGVLASNQSIADSAVIQQKFGILATAAAEIGTPQIRNMGTIGGNLCHAAPSADTASPLIALGARVKLTGGKGERTVPLEEFFTGPGETALQPDELLTEIQVPKPPPHTSGAYLKLFPRGAVDVATVGVAVWLTLGEDNTCRDARIVLGAVAPTPIRAKIAEALIKGSKMEDKVIEEVAQMASEEARPISDIRGSAEYRREMVKVLTRRALKQSLEQARSVQS
jgi:carbon-monoxide dehydrogenase medium subunit